MIKKITLLMMMSMALFAHVIISANDSKEITVIANQQLQEACRNVVDCCKDRQVFQELHALLGDCPQGVDCDALLRALEQCIAAEHEAQTEQEQANLRLLEENYQLLADIHAQLLKQLGTRARIKIKFFAKLYADELVVTNNMVVDGTLVVRDCLRMPNESEGLYLVNNGGCIVGKTLLEIEIPDGSVTTADLADGSVTTPKFADEAVTAEKISTGAIDPVNFSFKVLQTSDAETTPLRVVRGYVTVSAGVPTIKSGEGFRVIRGNQGIYNIIFTNPYSSPTSYSVFLRPFYVGPAINGGFYLAVPSTDRIVASFLGSTGLPPFVDPAGFEFFTIGT